MAPVPDSYAELWAKKEWSDFEVSYHDASGNLTSEWKAHRDVVCSRSTWFKNMCGSGFREAAEKKATIEYMEGVSADDIEIFLAIYTSTYDGGELKEWKPNLRGYPQRIPNPQWMSTNVKVYRLASYFQVPILTNMAIQRTLLDTKKFAEYIHRGWKWPIRGVPNEAAIEKELKMFVEQLTVLEGEMYQPLCKAFEGVLADHV